MNIRHALILVVSVASLLSGCTTNPIAADQAHLDKLLRHRSWPRIEQIAKTEVKKREKLLGWPDTAAYLPFEHKDKAWVVAAMAETPVRRVVTLWIGDDGSVLEYKRHWEGER